MWENTWRVGEQRRIRVLYTVVAPVAGAKEEWGRERRREVAGGKDRESSRHGGRERRAPLAIHDSTPPLQACTSVGMPAMARALRTSFLTTRRRSTTCPSSTPSPCHLLFLAPSLRIHSSFRIISYSLYHSNPFLLPSGPPFPASPPASSPFLSPLPELATGSLAWTYPPSAPRPHSS